VLAPGGVAAIALLAVAIAARSRAADSAEQVFAVGEFRDASPPDGARAVPVLADLLATSLARLPTLHVLSGARLLELKTHLAARRGSSAGAIAAARAGGASVLVQGTVATESGERVLDLELVDIATGRIHASIEVRGRDIFELVDRATAVMAERYGVRAPDQPVAAVTTRSLLGYRFYEEGLRAYFQGDVSAARRLFEAALGEDSTFALAAFYAAMTTAPPRHDAVLTRANRLADRVSERERLLIRATWQASRQDPAALATAESLVVRHPSDPSGFRLRGAVRATRGDFAGAVGDLRHAIAMDSLSLAGRSPMCAACDAYLALAGTYQQWDSLPRAAAVAREWMARRPDDLTPWSALISTLEWQSDDAALDVIRQAQNRFGRAFESRWVPAILAIRGGRHEEADRRLQAMLADGDSATRTEATWYLAISLRDQGRLAEAAALRPSDSLVRAIVSLEGGDAGEAARILAALARSLPPLAPGHAARARTWLLTHLATAYHAAGDTARLGALADSVERAGRLSLFGRDARLHHYVRGLLARGRGDAGTAERELRAAVHSWNTGYTRINLELGRTLLELGRPLEAVDALRPALRGSIESSNLYVTRTELHELMGRAFAAAGARDSARVHFAWVEAAWRRADPRFRGRHEAARRALAH
jgi:tetratricopeptide (TPR) repeat protein